MRKWLFEFLKKFENRGIKIDIVNSNQLTLFCTVLGVRFFVDIFKVTVRAYSINREVYG